MSGRRIVSPLAGSVSQIRKGCQLAQIEITSGTVTYLHNDLTGSVTASTDAIGQLIRTVDFSSYGSSTGSLVSRFGYAGEWIDEVTGYSYLRARWLDTVTGTFLAEDPLAQTTNNAFGYTEGNPITQIDPLGLFWKEVGEGLKSAGNWTMQNSGTISTVLGTAALVATATGIGAPLAPFLGAASLTFGALGVVYEGAACLDMIEKACDPGQLALATLGTVTGGSARIISKVAKPNPMIASTAGSMMNDLENISFVTGFSNTAISFFGMGLNALSSIDWDEEFATMGNRFNALTRQENCR